MKCDCGKWATNIPKMNSILTMAHLRNNTGYKGDPFVICPWCGKDLVEETDESTNGKAHS